jgi:hypothetical protein
VRLPVGKKPARCDDDITFGMFQRFLKRRYINVLGSIRHNLPDRCSADPDDLWWASIGCLTPYIARDTGEVGVELQNCDAWDHDAIVGLGLR